MSDAFWRRCNMCKNQIDYEQKIYECSVSTCRQKRTGMVFCSLGCWEAHLPMMRHRDAWAEDGVAPTQAEAEAASAAAQAKQAKAAPTRAPAASAGDGIARPGSPISSTSSQRRVVDSPVLTSTEELPRDVLVVVSKLKKYIKARAGMNTAEDVLDVLSDQIRQICNRAITHAAEDGRKTVKGRDFEKSGQS
jgi:histone H3/H4